jgi:pimeloyl-ACP methyl ester carboxylesterase
MTPIVLIHGGGFDSRCWDLVVPRLTGPVIAVDLPGRGVHPMPLERVGFDTCAETVCADIDAAGFDQVILAGHSLAGCSMPAMVARLGSRVRQAVFIGCTVPEQGRSAFDTLDPEVQALAQGGAGAPADDAGPGVMSGEIARIVLGNDLSDEQLAWCVERFVPEAPRLSNDPVDPSPLRGVPATWIRTRHDVIVHADKQLRFATNVGPQCGVVDIDAGHMCMASQPQETARLLDELAGLAVS